MSSRQNCSWISLYVRLKGFTSPTDTATCFTIAQPQRRRPDINFTQLGLNLHSVWSALDQPPHLHSSLSLLAPAFTALVLGRAARYLVQHACN